jgi:hypothetical protein
VVPPAPIDFRLVTGETPAAFYRRVLRSHQQSCAIRDFPKLLEATTLTLGRYAEHHGMHFDYVQQAVASHSLFNEWIKQKNRKRDYQRNRNHEPSAPPPGLLPRE